jgi:Zn finger protein HypA/HybF involved in hydrogenase expression
VTELRQLNRTLEQELNALVRGASLECLVCGEFVLHRHGSILCPECGSALGNVAGAAGKSRLQLGSQAG